MNKESERKRRYRVSYVLPLQANTDGGHRLGVNGLAIDSDRSILYSGGRDGVVCSWDLNVDLGKTSASVHDSQSIVTEPHLPRSGSGGGYGRPFSPESTRNAQSQPPSTLRDKVQAHMDWVNDITLVSNNHAIVSASSDQSIKIWRPNFDSQVHSMPHTLGVHTDYAKVVASPGPDVSWVASGGLDRKVYVWDLNGKGEVLNIDVAKQAPQPQKSSVYALAATNNILAAGGVDSIVRLWDARSGKRTTQLVGHTDVIRSILIAEDGETVLTASSDSTVKLWNVTTGRCDYTLTMHKDSVWSLYSDHPQLEVFYSADITGLVAKTDARGKTELDEGACVAICQESDGVVKLRKAGDYIWTATKMSSINRWEDVHIEDAENLIPESASTRQRGSMATLPNRSRFTSGSISQYSNPFSDSPRHNSPAPPNQNSTAGEVSLKNLLRLSNTAPFPVYRSRDVETATLHSAASIRRPTEIIIEENQAGVCVRTAPDFTIEGQHGLSRHAVLNNKRFVLTVDTAGEVVMWDLMKSFGKRHLDEVYQEVNMIENVANWCTVDTRMGALMCVLEDNSCFDAEMYFDEYEESEGIDYKEDQRINFGKWILRYVFDGFIVEQIRRDDQLRRDLYETYYPQILPERTKGPPGPIRIPSPQLTSWFDPSSAPTSASTLKPMNGFNLTAQTPGLAIGPATPGFITVPPLPTSPGGTALYPGINETTSPGPGSARGSSDGRNSDYFSSRPLSNSLAVTPGGTTNDLSRIASNLVPLTPTNTAVPRRSQDQQPPLPAGSPLLQPPGSSEGDPNAQSSEKSGLFGKFRGMNLIPKGLKKTDKSTEPKTPAPEDVQPDAELQNIVEESEGRESFLFALKQLRNTYERSASDQATNIQSAAPAEGLVPEIIPTMIMPPMPSDTPVLRLPPHMVILLQYESRDSSGAGMGVTTVWEGTVDSTAQDTDILERVAPSWFATLLLRNILPRAEIPKVSFMLEPWNGILPRVCPEPNTRLTANRMLRARKIISYVAERIEPAPPADTDPTDIMKPEEYIELYCKDQLIQPMMTLGTVRAYIWQKGADVVFHYKANGRKHILNCPQATADVGTTSTTQQDDA